MDDKDFDATNEIDGVKDEVLKPRSKCDPYIFIQVAICFFLHILTFLYNFCC